MLDLNDAQGQAVVTRVLDFFGDRTSWQRRLWTVGSVMRLKEAAEAVELLDAVPAAQRGLDECKASARDLAKIDPGVAGQMERGRIAGMLSGPIPAGGALHLQVQEIAKRAETGYLLRWAAALRAGEVTQGPEAIARMVASYLLDGGSSAGHLYRWWERFARHNADETHALADLLELADERVVRRGEQFEVLVLFSEFPNTRLRPAGWITPGEAETWLLQRGYAAPAQQVGGLRKEFAARDAGAAAEQARDLLDIYGSRVTVARDGRGWQPMSKAWVAGGRDPIEMPRSRRVDVPVLERESQLFAQPTDQQVDSGLQLVSLLDEGSAAAAVAGAWAGLESLLKAPGDSGAHHVAPRLSRLVACSFCRSELTDLAWHRIRRIKDQVSQELRGMDTNLERSVRVAGLVRANSLGVADPSDVAGAHRMRKILDDPRAELETVRQNADDALRRLYRQRDAVLHAGKTGAVALPSTLRVTAPLVGAGIDRVAHGWFVDGIEPLRLAAIAEMQLERLGTPDAVDVSDLLVP